MIGLVWHNDNSHGGVSRDGGLIEVTDSLESAIILSLFCWSTRDIEGVPDDIEERRGYWADAYSDGDRWGSDLWQLAVTDKHTSSPSGGGRVNEQLMELAAGSIRRALRWLVDDGIASEILVEVERYDRDRVSFRTEIIRGHGGHFSRQWEVTLGAA